MEKDDMENETLNEAFFAVSSLETAGFDSVVLFGYLDNLAQSSCQETTNPEVGSVIEFADNYGKKGLIKVT